MAEEAKAKNRIVIIGMHMFLFCWCQTEMFRRLVTINALFGDDSLKIKPEQVESMN